MHAMGLLAAILPEVESIADSKSRDMDAIFDPERVSASSSRWEQTLAMLHRLKQPSFSLSLAALLHAVGGAGLADTIGRRWRLARKETELSAWLLEHQGDLAGAREKPWSQIQPLLAADVASELIELHDVKAKLSLVDPSDVSFCSERLSRPQEELNPPPLIGGADLIGLGIPRGPEFAKLLQMTREAQLDGVVQDRGAALAFVQSAWRNQSIERP
jgi:hypothetical protein